MAMMVFATWLSLLVGCNDPKKRDTKPPTGAATVEELLHRYRRAHEKKDIADLRGILEWEAHLSYHRLSLEKPIIELFDMPLAEIRYVAGPKLPYERGGEAAYILPRSGEQPQEDCMIGPICGKILLVEKTDGGREPRVFDPSYIVIKAHNLDGRYYIDIQQPVAEDAARAYKTNTPPKYIPKPLGINN